MSASLRVNAPLVFRLHGNAPDVVREVLLERGWEEFDPQEREEGDWNLCRRGSAFRSSDYEKVLPWQRLNHHLKNSKYLKQRLTGTQPEKNEKKHGPALYGFGPLAFILEEHAEKQRKASVLDL